MNQRVGMEETTASSLLAEGKLGDLGTLSASLNANDPIQAFTSLRGSLMIQMVWTQVPQSHLAANVCQYAALRCGSQYFQTCLAVHLLWKGVGCGNHMIQ
jgi:hypothetical protein